MIMAVDIGNSAIELGVFQNDALSFVSAFETMTRASWQQIESQIASALQQANINASHVDGLILCSVVPQITHTVVMALKQLFCCEVLIVSPGVKTGIDIKVKNSGYLGTDLVCAAVCASQEYPLPCVVFDLGTATTAVVVDKGATLLGSVIMPGVRSSLEGLIASASCLTAIGFECPPQVIGTNTVSSMQAGLLYGHASMIDGIAKRIAQTLQSSPVHFVATGGYAALIMPQCETPFTTDAHLVLKGLYAIYQKNNA